MGKIVRLPGTEVTPEALFSDLLSRADDIIDAVVIYTDKDSKKTHITHTVIDRGDLCAAAVLLHHYSYELIADEGDDEEPETE